MVGTIRTKQLKNKQESPSEITYNPHGDELIDLSYSDKSIFGDVIRTINVSLPENCLLCDLMISTDRVFPVLYSDNDYTSISNNSVRFSIPDNPPQKMTFSYGAAMTSCKITVSAVIAGNAEDEYQFISKAIEIGDR